MSRQLIPNTQTESLDDHQQGTNDTLIAVNNVMVFGDAAEMFNHSIGGDDTMIGISAGTNTLVGDAYSMNDRTYGGNDTLIGGYDAENNFFGDAVAMLDYSHGGNDTLIGGSGSANFLRGDSYVLQDNAKGGNDVLIAGTGLGVLNNMWGDGALTESAQGGADLFVFKDSGSMTVGANNAIFDFSQSQHDQIVFSGVAGVSGFGDLSFSPVTYGGIDSTRILTGGPDAVTLVGFTGLPTASDFLFA